MKLTDDSKRWLWLALAGLILYWLTRPKATTTSPVVTVPKSTGGSLNALAGSYSGSSDSVTTPTTPTTSTEIVSSVLPVWLPAISYGYSETNKDLSIWLISSGLVQVKVERVDGAAMAGDGWVSGVWGGVDTAAALLSGSNGYSIAPYTHVKRSNHGGGNAGVLPGQIKVSVRRIASPNDVYTITLPVAGEKSITLLAGVLPVSNPTPTPTPTPEPTTDPTADTIESWAMTSRTYGAPRLKYVNDTSFFNPRIVDNGDGTISVVDDANYAPGAGKIICYELNYYGAERDIRTLVGRKFTKPYPVLIVKYEAAEGGGQEQALIDAKQELNEVIY